MSQHHLHTARVESWTKAFEKPEPADILGLFYGVAESESWRDRYLSILEQFVDHFGVEGEVAIARCPAQMNILGMHIDYAGMPSLRMAIRGADTITVARAAESDQVRLRSVTEDGLDSFPPVDFDLGKLVPAEDVGTREGIMAYAGEVCGRREAATGSSFDDGWDVIPQGGLIFLDSYLRHHGAGPVGPNSTRGGIGGIDALTWSNVSPRGGMSSSSALLISTAFAALGARGLDPFVAVGEEALIDGLGSSEWLRGTRGGTADHGGMVMGSNGNLVSVGVFPARAIGRAQLMAEYAPFILDSKVPRVYNESVKEETVAAYSLGSFVIRDLLLPRLRDDPAFSGLPVDFKEKIHLLRDVTAGNLGIGLRGICRLLAELPASISLDEVAGWASADGAQAVFDAMLERDIAGKYQHLRGEDPIFLRRRVTFALAEQSRVESALASMAQGRMEDVLDLIRISHTGDRDQEVDPDHLRRVGESGGEGLGLAGIPGGYGRMTDAYDAVVCHLNEYLVATGGATAGAVQRLGAGWGGNVGGLVHLDFLEGDRRDAFRHFLHEDLHLDEEPGAIMPGEGARLLPAPR